VNRAGRTLLYGVVEGVIDEAVVRRLWQDLPVEPGPIYGKNGKSQLRERIQSYNSAARRLPWLVLVDLDHDADCAPALKTLWLPNPARYMCFRVAVREIEAWLLADREGIASFLSVPLAGIPRDPDHLPDPKRTMVRLAGRSALREIREDMTPRPRSGRSEGPAYASRLIEFVQRCWRPRVAARSSDSLSRCRRALQRLSDVLPMEEV